MLKRFAVAGFPLLTLLMIVGCEAGADPQSQHNATVPEATNKSSMPKTVRGNWPLFRGDSFSSGVSQSGLPDSPELLWRYIVKDGAFESTAAIVDGMVYLGDLDGTFYALDLESGHKQWEFKTEDQAGFLASAAVQDGLVYIGDMDGRFYCLQAMNGDLNWSFFTQAEINSSANFYQENVLVGSQDATLYCLNAHTGELTWKHTIEDQIRCAPTVVENRAFLVGCDAQLHIVDLELGMGEQSVQIDSPSGTTPAVRGDLTYFGTHGGTFYCIDWKQREIVWTYRDPDSQQSFRSSAAVNGDWVVVGSRSRRVYGLNPQDGEARWVFPTQKSVDSSPVIVGDRVFVGSSDGRLYAIDLKSGEAEWNFEAGGGIVASPAVAEGRLVIASDDGTVFCLGQKK